MSTYTAVSMKSLGNFYKTELFINTDRKTAVATAIKDNPGFRPFCVDGMPLTQEEKNMSDVDFDESALDLNPTTITEIHNPVTGKMIDADDIDGLITNFEQLKTLDAAIYATKTLISNVLAAKTIGDAKTRRIEGTTRRAKIEMPDDSWDQKQLKDAWERYPTLRDRCLKIGSIAVGLREYKKIRETAGEPVFNEFRDAIASANRGPTSTPRVVVEV